MERQRSTISSGHRNRRSSRPGYIRTVQNFTLVWLDGSIDEMNSVDCFNTIIKLRQVVNTVRTFTDIDECIDFITDITDEKIFVIASGSLGQTMAPVLHDMYHVSSIYIFCENKLRHEQWARQWPKVKGVFTDIIPICEALKQAVQECDSNLVSISFVAPSSGASTQNLDQLDQSFMYTQILKEILVTIDFEQGHFEEFLTFCHDQFVGNTSELINIDRLQREYLDHVPIWWYTCKGFLHSMLNRALRTMEVDLIIKMGFFIRDLHKHITQLHSEQFIEQPHLTSLTVYRGQGLPQIDFDQLKKTQGGLVSFNNFLSTSKNHQVSLRFARRTIITSDNLMGILFVITIDPSIPSTPFANICDVSYYKKEEEILFSMHSIFRIGQIEQIDNNPRLWQVDLVLTNDKDPQLHDLTERMREETFPDENGWDRLGMLLIKLGQFNKAEEVYDVLLDRTVDQGEKAHLYHMLGMVKDNKGEYTEAVTFYELSIEIKQEILSPTDCDLAASYNNIGMAYFKLNAYSKTLWYYEKALEIRQTVLPATHHYLATSYNNIGSVYGQMGEYSKALFYYEKALEIFQKTLPANHPYLAVSYDNLGSVYDKMGDYSKALSSHQKALEIEQKTLPTNHPDLASSYNNIGLVYHNMGEYSKAILSCGRAVKILEYSLPSNHPDLKLYQDNLEYVKKNYK